jgi:hypothetical protein
MDIVVRIVASGKGEVKPPPPAPEDIREATPADDKPASEQKEVK